MRSRTPGNWSPPPQSKGGFGFDPEKIWVTVLGPGGHHPDHPDGDTKAYKLWRKVGVPEERIQRRGLKDNYWNMGVPGPGGPCSEIYIDRGPEYGADGGPEADEDRFLEIWNLVFQTEELSAVRAKDDFDVKGTLPNKNIDTGMGLERVAFLLQGKENMYEIDEIYPVIEKACELSGAHLRGEPRRRRADARGRRPRPGVADADERWRGARERGPWLRVAPVAAPQCPLDAAARGGGRAGAARAAADQPGPDGRVLPPEVIEAWPRVERAAYAEEEAFRRTLTAGTSCSIRRSARPGRRTSRCCRGDKAFQLHDTFGFPIDLTLEMAQEAGLQVDRDRFVELMGEQRARAKADAKAKKGGAQNPPERTPNCARAANPTSWATTN